MAASKKLQISANMNGGNSAMTQRMKPSTRPVSRPATNGSSTGNPSLRAVHAVVGHPARGQGINAAADPMAMPNVNADSVQGSPPVLMDNVSPRQVIAASMLIEGRLGKDVATAIGVTAETISRWRHRPEFEALMRELLQDSIDATRLGIVSLCAESIVHLRGLVRSFDNQTSLKAITLLLNRAAPVLGVIGADLRQPPPHNDPGADWPRVGPFQRR